MRRREFRFFALTGAVLAAAAISPVRAQEAAQGADDAKRAVARISLMDGQVSVRRGDADWVAGIVNAPLMTDDRIATAANSRAEVQLDASHLLRLGGNAEIHLTQLEYGRFQMELVKGTLTYRVFRVSNANAEVDTPTVSVRPSRVGVYRISVSESGETEVTPRLGDVEVFTPKGSQWINTGQTMMARGSASDPEFQIVGAIAIDDWDHWNEGRDQIFVQPSQSAEYTDAANSGMTGTEDLDANGTWTTVPDYGPVWRPTNVPVGWSPYSNGRWVWSDWYGWTWVDYDTWGWAPFHYGRWFYGAGIGWAWYPGGIGGRHYWSPGLVAFFGYGVGGGFGFGFGNVGWVALAPYEAFHPWWGRGFYGGAGGFYRNANIAINANVSATYRNARVSGGVMGMAAGDFRNGRFSSLSHVSGEQMRTAGLVRGQVPLSPTSASTHFSSRQTGFTPAASANTHFFTHQQPAQVAHVPFSQQTRAAGGGAAGAGASAAGRSVTGSPAAARPAAASERPAASPSAAPARQPAAVESNTRPNGGNTGWRRFGEPGGSSGAPQANTAPQGNSYRGGSAATENTRPQGSNGSTGWQRFGNPGTGSQSNAPRPSQPAYSAPRSAPAPSYSAPRSAPAPSSSAPRSNGGGGGGGSSRPSSGGGHSSGGSGGRHR